METALCVVLAGVWGGVWAVCLQHTPWGQFLAEKRTWVAVVIGVGGDLLILAALLTLETWLVMVAVIGVSSLGIIGRSLANEHREHRALMEWGRDEHTDPAR